MKFTIKELQLIRIGIDHAFDELHNLKATCPDVVKYSDGLVEIENQRLELEKIAKRIDTALGVKS